MTEHETLMLIRHLKNAVRHYTTQRERYQGEVAELYTLLIEDAEYFLAALSRRLRGCDNGNS